MSITKASECKCVMLTKALVVKRTNTERNSSRLSVSHLNPNFMNSSTSQACPFQVDVHCEGTQPSTQPLSMNSGPKLLNQALQKSITARTGAKALRGQDNVFIYTYRGEHRISSLIANKVDNRLRVEVII